MVLRLPDMVAEDLVVQMVQTVMADYMVAVVQALTLTLQTMVQGALALYVSFGVITEAFHPQTQVIYNAYRYVRFRKD